MFIAYLSNWASFTTMHTKAWRKVQTEFFPLLSRLVKLPRKHRCVHASKRCAHLRAVTFLLRISTQISQQKEPSGSTHWRIGGGSKYYTWPGPFDHRSCLLLPIHFPLEWKANDMYTISAKGGIIILIAFRGLYSSSSSKDWVYKSVPIVWTYEEVQILQINTSCK